MLHSNAIPPAPTAPLPAELALKRPFALIYRATLVLPTDGVMQLFDERERASLRWGTWGEPMFSYLNESARPEAYRVRALVEEWFSAFPDAGKRDVRSRFRSNSDQEHLSAFLEVYLHALLTRLGLDLEPHPVLPAVSTRPDFQVNRGGERWGYLEATIPSRPSEQLGQRSRINRVYEAVDEVSSPNFFLCVHTASGGGACPSTRGLRQRLQTWLATLDPDRVAIGYDAGTPLPEFVWRRDDWEVRFEAIPKKPEARGKAGARAIGAEMSEVEMVRTEERLREAIRTKARKYGRPDLPVVIAVDLCDQLDHVGPDDWLDLQNALLGSEAVRVAVYEDMSTRQSYGRSENGVWFGPQGARNAHISGVILSNHLSPWTVARVNPVLVHHPAALKPLDADGWPLPQLSLDLSRGWQEAQFADGVSAAEVFGLDPEWPRPDG